jgi:geranylgeranyl pyrophosphate synthase
MDANEYLLTAQEFLEHEYLTVLDEIEKDFGLRLKGIMSGGKKFRPMLTLLCCEACGGTKKEALDFAIALELIHQSTLAHDDVLDQDLLRRGEPAFFVAVSVGKAILSGDAGFAKALNIISKYGPKVTQAGAATIYALARGAVKEAMEKFPSLHLPDPYLEIAVWKTASLFALSCQLGAIAHYAPPVQEDACIEYGKNLGLAYQIADDYVDLVQTVKTGDPHGDLKDHRVTLPLFQALQGQETLRSLLPGFSAGNVPLGMVIRAVMDSPQGLEKSLATVQKLVQDAVASAQRLPDTPFRAVMEQIPGFMVDAMLKECHDKS